MPRAASFTAPSATLRRERAAARLAAGQARAAASRARALAEDQPRPSGRGRPRRKEASASLYCLTVRLSPDERKLVQSAATAAGRTVADQVRLQLVGQQRTPPRPVEIVLPASVDLQFARAVTALGNHTNQLARCWNTAISRTGSGEPFSLDERSALRELTERLTRLIDELSPEPKGALARLQAATRLVLGKKGLGRSP